MAFYSNFISHTQNTGLSRMTDSFGRLAHRLQDRLSHALRARQTFVALNRLNDRELADIGLHRSGLKRLSIESTRRGL